MTPESALKILSHHQKWRLGADIPPTDQKELTEALDAAIAALGDPSLADLESQLAELSVSYQRVLAQREALYKAAASGDPAALWRDSGFASWATARGQSANERRQLCTGCHRALPLNSFDKSERKTRLGVVYTCRECLDRRVSPCSLHGEE